MLRRRWNRFAPVLIAVAALACRARAQEPATPPNPDEVHQLAASPRPASVPAFRHRLFPLDSERTPGDAAPIYLRLPHETDPTHLATLGTKPFEYLGLPLDKFPVAEARVYVDGWKNRLRQIEYGARRQSCDWNYTLEEEKDHAYEILLPDAQAMRQWGRLVALKARVELAEGKLHDCVRTLETGLAFARHVGEGPFLINALIGIALSNIMLDRVEELIARPDAPNLYWALTALPRPLIGVRRGFENEVKMIDWIFPELGEVDRPRAPEEWPSLLARFHGRMAGMIGNSGFIDPEMQKSIRFEPDLAKFRAALRPWARSYLESRDVPVAGISDDQAIMMAYAGQIRELRDDWSKTFYLSFAEAGPVYQAIGKKYVAEKPGPLGLFVQLAPALEAVHAAETRLGRRVAALRVVEAARMQAAADRGKFPDSLETLTIVPVPTDPSSGKPFSLRVEGDALVISSGPIYGGRLVHRVTPRR